MTLRPSVARPLTVVSIGLSRKTTATINTVASLVSMTLPNQQCLLRSCEELNRFGKMLNGYSGSATRNVSSQTAAVRGFLFMFSLSYNNAVYAQTLSFISSTLLVLIGLEALTEERKRNRELTKRKLEIRSLKARLQRMVLHSPQPKSRMAIEKQQTVVN